MTVFENLIHPLSLQTFLSANWAEEGVMIRAENPRRFCSLFSWTELNFLLNFHKLRYPDDIRFAAVNKKGLESVGKPRDWMESCREGRTLILNQVHKLVPSLSCFTTGIQQDLGHRAQINLYCSWPGEQGFDLHYDGHDVFILQIEGSKKWRVFGESFRFPLEKHCRTTQFSDTPAGTPYLDVTLNTGDVLYIPRGHWHDAVACEEPSLHLTLGITCRTGLDWITWLAQDLEESVEWREALPLILAGDTGHIRSRLERLADKLAEQTRRPQFMDRFLADQLTATTPRDAECSLPAQAGFAVLDLASTRLRRARFLPLRVESGKGENGLEIHLDDRKILLNGVSRSLVDNIFAHDSFSLREGVAWAPELDFELDLLPLFRSLIEQGLLVVDEHQLATPSA
jgi:ribosomal protein L16 Arg81 hydroxylase